MQEADWIYDCNACFLAACLLCHTEKKDLSSAVTDVWQAHYASHAYACPYPSTLPINHTWAFHLLSAATILHNSDPLFRISISHSLRSCNAFRITITRTESAYCKETSKNVMASLDEEVDDFIKAKWGPDMFQLKFDGAERKVIHTPTSFSEEQCQYMFDVQLNAAGQVWLQLHQVYEKYDAVHEMPKHAPQSVWSQQFAAPLQLDVCSGTCSTYIPPPVGEAGFAYPAEASIAEKLSDLPTCRGPDAVAGTYVHSNPLSLLDPPYELPMSAKRPVAGFYEFVPAGCKYDHAGLRFRNHDACFERSHRALFVGDSHTRALCRGLTHRLTGGPEIANSEFDGIPLHSTFRGSEVDFISDTFMRGPFDCDVLGRFDSITVSTGAHQLALDPTTSSVFMQNIQESLRNLSVRTRECAAGASPKLIFVGTAAHNSQKIATHPLDARSGQRLEYLTRKMNKLAKDEGYSVLDTFALTHPIAPDTALLDGIHFFRTDAQDPLIDDWIEKSGFCY